MQEFAGDGLRTLALAYKDLDEEYFSQWKQRHHEASTELEDRESKLDQLYEEIEKDLLVEQEAHTGNTGWILQFARVLIFLRGNVLFAAPGSNCYRRQITGQSTGDD